MFIIKVCQALESLNIPYAIVGGFAVALHGAVRGTIDVDIVVKWTLENLEKAENALKGIGLKSRIPIDAKNVFKSRKEYIEHKNLIAWNFYNPVRPIEQVDIIITYNLDEASILPISTPFGEVKVLSLKSLIVMKKQSGRPQDLEDVKALENL